MPPQSVGTYSIQAIMDPLHTTVEEFATERLVLLPPRCRAVVLEHSCEWSSIHLGRGFSLCRLGEANKWADAADDG